MMIRRNCRLLPVLVLMIALGAPRFASAQGRGRALTFLNVQSSRQTSAAGLTPAQIKRAYGFDQIGDQGDGQTIAIITAYYDPSIEADLAAFNKQFGLPQCTIKNGCLQVIFSCSGAPCSSIPSQDASDPNAPVWAVETAVDVEWAHAIAPKANILLVEVSATGTDDGDPTGASVNDLLGGVDVALKHSVSVVSMSWGGAEFSGEGVEDTHFSGVLDVTFFASAGDSGHGVVYPAASPFVMSVGGTRLNIDPNGSYDSEKAWSGTGGGLSAYEPEPLYQILYPIPLDPQKMRGTPDVAYDAAPDTGVAVYDSVYCAGWCQVGGTSIGPPQWSGLVAIANSKRANDKKPALTGSQGVLYLVVQDQDNNVTYHDVSHGKDGNCGTLCKAKPGYDYLTGLGTPRANLLILALENH